MIYWGLKEKEKEQEALEYWCFRADHKEIPVLEKEILNELVTHPPQLCEDVEHCKSRIVCGQGCQCVRGLFEDMNQFNQYQEIQRIYVKMRVLEIILSGIPICLDTEESVESNKEPIK